MDTALWIVTGIVAAAFVVTGLAKLLIPHAKLAANPGTAWATDYTPAQVRLIGLVEVLGAIGLVVPPLVDTAEVLVPLAAAGLALTMLGAFGTHLRRGDPRTAMVPPLVLGTLAVVIAIGRAWVAPF